MTADFDPDVVATAGRHHAEGLARREARRREIVLHSADLVQRLTRLGRQQLVEHALDRVERERARSKLELPCRRDDVGTLPRVEDERVSVGTNDGGQQRLYEGHSSPKRSKSIS